MTWPKIGTQIWPILKKNGEKMLKSGQNISFDRKLYCTSFNLLKKDKSGQKYRFFQRSRPK